MTSFFRRYLMPGLIFQSIAIAGGYGTGRELVEFFLQFSPVGGLLGLVFPATIVISVVAMISFELARMTSSYDYRSFLQQLLGPFWFLYDVLYFVTVLLILAVVGAATGSLVADSFGIPGLAGTLFLMGAIAFLTFKGSAVIEGVLSVWSFVLYTVYAAVFIVSLWRFGPQIRDAFASHSAAEGWLLSGFRYGSLQVSLIPAMLFATTYIGTRREAFIAGALTGPIFITPALLFFFAMAAHYPDILDRAVPVSYILEALQSPLLVWIFPIVLFGTFIETGAGLIHGFNERLESALEAAGKVLPDYFRSIVAISLLIAALLMSRLGLIKLIAVGYGTLAWLFIAILVIPLLTIGLRKITR